MLRIIGDCHGVLLEPRANGRSYNTKNPNRCYFDLIKGCDYTLQVGDLGYGKLFHILMSKVSESRHKVVLGNHDDYGKKIPHQIGDYGEYTHGNVQFAFLRGEHSIDYKKRIPGVEWWHTEQIDAKTGNEALDFFSGKQYNLFVSHGCPSFLLDEAILITKYHGRIEPSYTCRLLSEIFNVCKIKTWVFGHHHIDFDVVYKGTRFICLNEFAYVEVDDNGKVGAIQ